MATAVAVQSALAGRWTNADYDDRMVVITCFAIEDGAENGIENGTGNGRGGGESGA